MCLSPRPSVTLYHFIVLIYLFGNLPQRSPGTSGTLRRASPACADHSPLAGRSIPPPQIGLHTPFLKKKVFKKKEKGAQRHPPRAQKSIFTNSYFAVTGITFVEVDSIPVVHVFPSVDTSILNVYSVFDTSFIVTRSFIGIPSISSAVHDHVSPFTVPLAESSSPMLSNAWYEYIFLVRSHPITDISLFGPIDVMPSECPTTKNPPGSHSYLVVVVTFPSGPCIAPM